MHAVLAVLVSLFVADTTPLAEEKVPTLQFAQLPAGLPDVKDWQASGGEGSLKITQAEEYESRGGQSLVVIGVCRKDEIPCEFTYRYEFRRKVVAGKETALIGRVVFKHGDKQVELLGYAEQQKDLVIASYQLFRDGKWTELRLDSTDAAATDFILGFFHQHARQKWDAAVPQ